MKKLISVLVFLNFTCIWGGSLTIKNSCSEEITVTLQTAEKTYTQTFMATENQIVNTLYNSVLKTSIIDYDNTDVEIIVIERISTTTPQIICKSLNSSVDTLQKPTGIYALNMTSRGVMSVLQDSVNLENMTYDISDLSSFLSYCNFLKQNLASNTLEKTEKKIEVCTALVKKLQNCDKASDMLSQITILQSIIHDIADTIMITKNLMNNIQTVEQTTAKLSSSNAEQAKKTLHTMQASLKTILQAPLHAITKIQARTLQNSIHKLTLALNQIGFNEQLFNFEILVPYEKEIAEDSMQINQMMQINDMIKN